MQHFFFSAHRHAKDRSTAIVAGTYLSRLGRRAVERAVRIDQAGRGLFPSGRPPKLYSTFSVPPVVTRKPFRNRSCTLLAPVRGCAVERAVHLEQTRKGIVPIGGAQSYTALSPSRSS